MRYFVVIVLGICAWLYLYKGLPASWNLAANGSATAGQKTGERIGQPIDMKFTAVGGQKVDLSKMRGKVVLIDFWATWCGPCMDEVHQVVAAYRAFHAKGFEIVGISLDQSKQRLLDVTMAHGMTWPQYFDGQGWGNDLARQYGIKSIPCMWLINKQGKLADTDARKDLQGKVKKLLAE